MIAPDLDCGNDLMLINPNVDRDAPIATKWMQGSVGQQTQRSMGIPPQDIHEHTLAESRDLFEDFISTQDEIVWVIQYKGKIGGVIEVGMNRNIAPEEQSPSLSIMIGDVSLRGKGVGSRAMRRVIEYLFAEGYPEVNARYLIDNDASRAMNKSVGMQETGRSYVDEDGLEWQNVRVQAID